MFNGIIYHQGKIKKISNTKKGKSIFVFSKIPLSQKNIGISIACDGVCLTLVSFKNNTLEFYLLDETIRRSKFCSAVSLFHSHFLSLPCESIG